MPDPVKFLRRLFIGQIGNFIQQIDDLIRTQVFFFTFQPLMMILPYLLRQQAVADLGKGFPLNYFCII